MPSALELIDRTCLHAVAEWQGWDLPEDANALLLAKVDEPGARGEELADAIEAHFRAARRRVASSARSSRTTSTGCSRPGASRIPRSSGSGPVLTEDVCVPRGAVPEMLARIEAAAADAGVVIANIAHAGDGNLHPLIIAPEGDDDAKAAREGGVRPHRRRLPRPRRHRHRRARRRAAQAPRRRGGAQPGGARAAPRDQARPRPAPGMLNPGKAFPNGD